MFVISCLVDRFATRRRADATSGAARGHTDLAAVHRGLPGGCTPTRRASDSFTRPACGAGSATPVQGAHCREASARLAPERTRFLSRWLVRLRARWKPGPTLHLQSASVLHPPPIR